MKKQKKMILVTVMAVVMACTLSGCSQIKSLTMDVTERTQQIIDAYRNGDFETFVSYVEDGDKLEHMMTTVQNADDNAEGMVAVYRKVYEIAKTAEFSAPEESEDKNNGEYATVTVKTVDFSAALEEAMKTAAAEGGEAFADMPAWMMAALETGGEPVEKEVEVRVKSNGVLYGDEYNEEFLDVLTVGFYDYIMYTMTSCIPNDESSDTAYMIASYDIVKITLDEYVQSDEGIEFTEEEVAQMVDEFGSAYDSYDGITVGGNKVDGGIRVYMLIDCTKVDMSTMAQLGMVASSNIDYIGLATSVEGFESSGYTCESEDFGSGALSTLGAE